jgi:hypothetical protein
MEHAMRTLVAEFLSGATVLAALSSVAGAASAATSLDGIVGQAYYSFSTPVSGYIVNIGEPSTIPFGGTFSSIPYGGGDFSGNYAITGDKIAITAGPDGAQWGPNTYFGFFLFTSRFTHVLSVSLDGATTANGVTASDADVESSPGFIFQSITFALWDQNWSPGQSAIFDLRVGGDPIKPPPPPGVPEPSVWTMLVGGLGIAGAVLRGSRRKRADA